MSDTYGHAKRGDEAEDGGEEPLSPALAGRPVKQRDSRAKAEALEELMDANGDKEGEPVKRGEGEVSARVLATVPKPAALRTTTFRYQHRARRRS